MPRAPRRSGGNDAAVYASAGAKVGSVSGGPHTSPRRTATRSSPRRRSPLERSSPVTGRRLPLLLVAGLLALVAAPQALALPRAWSPPVDITPAPAKNQVFHDAVVALNAAGDAVAGWQRD